MAREDEVGPRIRVEQIGHEPGNVSGAWRVTWGVRNVGRETLKLVDASLPHGKFRGQRADLTALDAMEPGSTRTLSFRVAFQQPHGSIVENTFLILTLIAKSLSWRIFVRMTVEADPSGAPMARTELVTRQKVGFSKAGC